MKKIDFEKLELNMYTYIENDYYEDFDDVDDDENYHEVFNVKFIKEDDEPYSNTKIGIFKAKNRKRFAICNSHNRNFHLGDLVDNLGSNFTSNINITYDGKRIGHACITRIFVDSLGTILSWLDNECPNSMELVKYIEKKDYKKVEARYIGLIDELMIDTEYYSEDLVKAVINSISSLFDYYKLGMYYIYTIPKDTDSSKYIKNIKSELTEKEYKKHGFKVVDKELNILRKSNWANQNIMAGMGGFYEIV